MENGHSQTISNELALAVIADECRQDKDLASRFHQDCGAALKSLFTGAILDADIRVAQNTPDLVHIVLPDYEARKEASMNKLSDEDIAQISGGEIITAILCLTLTVGTIAGVGAAGGVIAATVGGRI